MSRLGETVLYGTEGVCKIVEICEMKVGRKREKYYLLKPLHREGATVFVPVDNEVLLAKMRTLLSREEIHSLIDHAAETEALWIEDPGERKTAFQSILLGGDRQALLSMIRLLYQRRRLLQEKGKHLRSNDEQILRDAEKLLNEEFSLVLEILPREVPDYIRSRMEA